MDALPSPQTLVVIDPTTGSESARHPVTERSERETLCCAGVVTRDRARGRAIAAERLEAGVAFVKRNVRSDARLPFGGLKDSGFGRELSACNIRELVNIKTVVVSDPPRETVHEAKGAVE